MRVLLIAPASGRWRGLGRRKLWNGKTFRFSMLSLLSVAALTPARHELRIVDEQIVIGVDAMQASILFHVRGSIRPAASGSRRAACHTESNTEGLKTRVSPGGACSSRFRPSPAPPAARRKPHA
jgi:hypothetical protein